MPELITKVKNVGARKHPDYDAKVNIWNFLLASYRGGMGMQDRFGGEGWRDKTKLKGYYAGLFKWRKENEDDYLNRVAVTPYRPYARRILVAFANYATKEEPTRTHAESFKDFLADVDGKNTPMINFVRHCLIMNACLGEFNVLVDMPTVDEQNPPNSKADEEARGLRPYCVPLMPHDIVDWSIGSDGRYEWVLIENRRVINKPDEDEAHEEVTRTYWDKQQFIAYKKEEKKWVMIDKPKPHPCGRVPVLHIVYEDADNDPLTPESWFYDLADMNRLIYNLDSIDVENFATQGHGQLILPGHNEEDIKKASTSEAWTEDKDERGISRYIQPSGIEHEKIENKILNTRSEMYRVAGLNHRTDSKDAESAEAKAWDFEEVNQFLKAFASTGGHIEEELTDIAAKWESTSGKGIESKYPTDFSVREISKIIEGILDLKQIGWTSETGRKEAIKDAYRGLFPNLTNDLKNKIDTEIDASVESNPLGDLAGVLTGDNV